MGPESLSLNLPTILTKKRMQPTAKFHLVRMTPPRDLDELSRHTIEWIHCDVRLRRPKRRNESYTEYAKDLVSHFKDECAYLASSKPRQVYAYVAYQLACRVLETLKYSS